MSAPRGVLRGIAAGALALAVLVPVACGDEEQRVTDLDGDDATAIAETINASRTALAGGDSEELCSLLSEEGRGFMEEIAREADPPVEAANCEEAAAAVIDSLSTPARSGRTGEPDYTAADIDIDPTDDPGFNDATDTVAESGSFLVEVPCKAKAESGSSYFAVLEGGEWRLTFPFCSGR